MHNAVLNSSVYIEGKLQTLFLERLGNTSFFFLNLATILTLRLFSVLLLSLASLSNGLYILRKR